jgi:hypothetical protein
MDRLEQVRAVIDNIVRRNPDGIIRSMTVLNMGSWAPSRPAKY